MIDKISNMDRIIAICCESNDSRDTALQLIKDFNTYKLNSSLMLFYTPNVTPFSNEDLKDLVCTTIAFPAERDSSAKQKNFIMTLVEGCGFKGVLHIVSSVIKLLKDPNPYIDSVENAMAVFDYNVYFSTITDRCNYLFNKFSPRLSIVTDDDELKQKLNLPDKISFTSHANTCWTIYRYADESRLPLKYNESFTIAMYEIIEYLARRRANRTPDQLYYMNQYLSISDELGVYAVESTDDKQLDQKVMQEEDKIFKSLNIDYSPDNNIDVILDAFYTKLKEKSA